MKWYRQDDATEMGKAFEQTGQRRMLELGNKKYKAREEKVRLMKEKQKYGNEWMQRNRKDWNAVCKHAESVGTGSSKQIQI